MATTVIVIGENGVTVEEQGSTQDNPSAESSPPTVRKRRKSRYQATYGRHFRRLRRIHPRYSWKRLVNAAHKATKAELRSK